MKRRISTLIMLLSLVANVFFEMGVLAADSTTIQIMPTRQKITLNPGDVYTGTFSVQNVGSEPFNYQTAILPYQVADKDYSPDFVTRNNRTKIVDWVSFDIKENTLSPGSYDTIKYTINVPEDAPAGGQYASIMAYTIPSNHDESVKIAKRVGMILYATVTGEVREDGQIAANNVSSIVLKPPLSAWTQIDNTGNVDAEAKVSLQVDDFFTKKNLYNNSETPNTVIVLPGTSRLQTSVWEDVPGFGIFKVTQTVQFVDQTSKNEKIVLICPLWILITTITIIVLCIILIISKIRRHKLDLAYFKHK